MGEGRTSARPRKGLDEGGGGRGGTGATAPWVQAHQMDTSMAAAGGRGRGGEGEQQMGAAALPQLAAVLPCISAVCCRLAACHCCPPTAASKSAGLHTASPSPWTQCYRRLTSQVKGEEGDVIVLVAGGAAAALHGQGGGAQHRQVQAGAKVPGLPRHVGSVPGGILR